MCIFSILLKTVISLFHRGAFYLLDAFGPNCSLHCTVLLTALKDFSFVFSYLLFNSH